jgi:hypothetical protein
VGAIIAWGLMFLMFIISIPILCVSIIFLTDFIKKLKSKRQYNKILFGFTIIGTIIGLGLFIVPVGSTLFLRTLNNSVKTDNVNTGLTIYWKSDINGNDRFIYNNNKYKYLLINNSQNSTSIEIDKAVANIIPENYYTLKLLSFIFGGESKKTLYTIKNCIDQSILTTGDESSVYYPLYCIESLIDIKKSYYDDLNNYSYYFTKDEIGNEEICVAISSSENSKVIELISLRGTEMDIAESEYEYITIFGISKDKIIHKFIADIIIDDDKYYLKDSSKFDILHEKIMNGDIIYPEDYPAIGTICVTLLSDDQKEFILSLLK